MTTKKLIRWTSLLIFCALFAAAGTLWLLPRTEALECDDGPGGVVGMWSPSTEGAREGTDAGVCGSDAVCEEWCIVACGEGYPQGIFRCTPIN